MISTQNEYHARLERVKLGGAHTKHTIFVGMDDSFTYHRSVAPKRSKATEFRQNAGHPISLALALLTGMLAYFLGRYVRFKLLATLLPSMNIDLDVGINAGLGVVATIVLSRLFKLCSRQQYSLQALGILVMTLGFHNLVHETPELFNAVFSPLWVNEVLTSTDPRSIVIRGVSFRM